VIFLTHQTPILLGVAPADFRKGIDGFVAVCEQTLALQPRDGTVFVFINRARTMIRALSYDGSGYWLMTKRLSKGRFAGWPIGTGAGDTVSAASARELRQLLGGGVAEAYRVASPSTSSPTSARAAVAISTSSTSLVS